ncbi:uncharacterized protein LOC115758621 isoform X1 [Drosophila novamexicana]|uniref:uncharacterized protein LOC115758621 isoform X1 n=1 Tax=Drosophila novamexicana TaxID=47314 RepID=UPI0011E5BAEB|nr:uncharacterized protein LOC115758621 isoform X1 [Drosophila novamexicana]
MDYGNSGAEFNWNYVGGVGQSGQGGQGMSGYNPQVVSQMSQGGYSSGLGGGQWLHSNQANPHSNYQQGMASNSTPPAAYEAYNQSMMRYANLPKSEGGGMGQMGMSAMGGNYGAYAAGMNRNGLGHAGAGMGQGANSGYTSW